MTKVVLKLQINQDKHKKKAMKIGSRIEGLDSISMDKDMKLTVIGDVDPVKITKKLRKLCDADIVLVDPEKEEKKNEPPKTKGPNLEPPLMVYHLPPPLYFYQRHHPLEAYFYGTSLEEDPTGCIIC